MREFAVVHVWIALLGLAVLAGPILAGEGKLVTLEGKVACATCSLKEEDRKDCQKVLIVNVKGDTEFYYLEHNAMTDKLGSDCKGSSRVRITGQVSEKNGQTWIATTKITLLETKTTRT